MISKNAAYVILIFFLLFIFGCNDITNNSGHQTDESNLSIEDLNDALRMVGIHIYNFNFSIPCDQQYYVKAFIDEYNNNELVKEWQLTIGESPYIKYEDTIMLQKDLDHLRLMIYKPDTSRTIKTEIKIETFSMVHSMTIDKKYQCKYYGFRKFRKQEIEVDKKIPFLMYGSWYVDKNGVLRWCFKGEMKPDFSNEEFGLIPLYYVYGIILITKDD